MLWMKLLYHIALTGRDIHDIAGVDGGVGIGPGALQRGPVTDGEEFGPDLKLVVVLVPLFRGIIVVGVGWQCSTKQKYPCCRARWSYHPAGGRHGAGGPAPG